MQRILIGKELFEHRVKFQLFYLLALAKLLKFLFVDHW